jgi:hypothetical protein
MKTKNFIIGTLVGTVVYFLLGWLVYGFLFKNIYPSDAEMSHGILFVFLGCLFFVALVAYIFSRWAGITNWLSGAKAGALIGFIYGAANNFFMYSRMEANYQNMFTDILLNLIMGAIAGAVIAFTIGMVDKK